MTNWEDTVMSNTFAKTLILTKHCSPETRPTDIVITDVEETLIEEQAEISFEAGYEKGFNDNRERILKRDRTNQRMANLRLKVEVLSYYGRGECRCCVCGMDNIDCLSLDHLNNNGYEHRKVLRSNSIYRFVKSKDYPEGYQTLCMNCQWIKKANVQRQRRLPSRS